MDLLPQTLTTSRLILRQARLDDADELFQVYCGVPECTRYLTRGVHTSILQTAKFLEVWCTRAWTEQTASFAWVIADRHTDQPIGTFVVVRDGNGSQIHFGIGKQYWGRGLVVEAGNAAVKWLFENNNLNQLSTVCDAEHVSSQRVLAKLGFERKGVLQQCLVMPAFGALARDGVLYSRGKV
jgi:ribosomal-protein-alanine N-acetyltransferase